MLYVPPTRMSYNYATREAVVVKAHVCAFPDNPSIVTQKQQPPWHMALHRLDFREKAQCHPAGKSNGHTQGRQPWHAFGGVGDGCGENARTDAPWVKFSASSLP